MFFQLLCPWAMVSPAQIPLTHQNLDLFCGLSDMINIFHIIPYFYVEE